MAATGGRGVTLGRADARGAYARVAGFLKGAGVTLEVEGDGTDGTSGVRVDGGRILVGSADDAVAGEVLHVAGRLAVMPGRFRAMARGDLGEAGAAMDGYVGDHLGDHVAGPEDNPVFRACLQSGEAEAAAWSYAAAVASGVDTRLPFHSRLCRSGPEAHWMLSVNSHGGINGLQAAGMTSVRGRPGMPAFPAMARWLAVD